MTVEQKEKGLNKRLMMHIAVVYLHCLHLFYWLVKLHENWQSCGKIINYSATT